MVQRPKQDTDMDADLKKWGDLVQGEVVPQRLRDLAMQLRKALIEAGDGRPLKS